MAASASTSQISRFLSVCRNFQQLHIRSLSVSSITLRSKAVAEPQAGLCHWLRGGNYELSVSLEGYGDAVSSKFKTTICYASDASKPLVDGIGQSYSSAEEPVAANLEVDEKPQDQSATQQKRAAKIHDFCFGIPYGGLVLSGGLLGFIFTRSSASLSTMFFGGALLAFSTFSLKVWGQGKSSSPFILGQAALAVYLIWKSFQSYGMTKKLFPTGFYGVISAAMLCFYSYVLLSGGNPPPKKLNSSAKISS